MKKYTLLLLLVFVFASGGCGGGGGENSSSLSESPLSEDTTPQVSAEFDSDGDGVPDVFGYFSEGYSNGRNAPGNGEAYDVPYLNYIAFTDTDENEEFTTKIYLKHGTEYVMKYSHSGRVLGDNDIDFSILTPDEKELAFDLGLSSNEDTPAPAEVHEVENEVISMDEDADLPDGEKATAETNTTKTYGAAMICYYADEEPGKNLNTEHAAYFDNSKWMANHEIAVIGWDDNYPKENFIVQPSSNGAWLARNSWGNFTGSSDGYE